MNKENVQKAIDVMERAKANDAKLYMRNWQDNCEYTPALKCEVEIVSCGTAACFGGWIAVSPEFRKDSGYVSSYGSPIFGDCQDEYAIAKWLDIDVHEAQDICLVGDSTYYFDTYFRPETSTDVSNITIDMVLKTLYKLRDTGSIYS